MAKRCHLKILKLSCPNLAKRTLAPGIFDKQEREI